MVSIQPSPSSFEVGIARVACSGHEVAAGLDANDAHRIVDLIAGNAPNAQKIIVEGSGHMVNMERPEEFNQAVLDFLPR